MPTRTYRRARIRRPALLAALALSATGLCAVPGTAQAAAADHTLPAHTRLFVPPPTSAAVSQIVQLARSGDLADAALLTKMEATSQAVWFTSGTPDQVRQQVRQTMAEASLERAVPVLVAYDIPGRDCAQYSSGGALDAASYEAWISAFAAGIGNSRAVVILEPDALGNLPSDCGVAGSSAYPFTDADRYAEIDYAVSALEGKPDTSVYLDATHSGWQSVGTMTQRLLLGHVQQAQGFYLNASNYQPDNELTDYGQWISDCVSIVTDPTHWAYNNPGYCASQYYPATQSDFSTWDLTTQWYAANMDGDTASTHYVIDTSRNGDGPNNMSAYAATPYDQPASVVSALASGSWCNPPDSGVGLRPTTQTGVPLLDAYLWIKTPGQSDGQCDSAGGARAWDYSAYTAAGWPTDAAGQGQFDPLWGLNDPAAGAWFPQQALQLARQASPPLLGH